MHGTSAGAPVPLSGLGGLVTLADSESVPEGASPRTYDTDYLVGKVKTRPGTEGVYSYAAGEVSKLPTEATDIPNGGAEWTNPAGVEGSASFASVEFGPEGAAKIPASVVSQGAGLPWQQPQNATATGAGTSQVAVIQSFSISGNVVNFTLAPMITPLVAGQTVTISDLGTGIYLNGQQLTVLSSGLSATSFQADFTYTDVSATYDAGFAMPQTAYASASNWQPIAPPDGQYSLLLLPTQFSAPAFTSGYPGFGALKYAYTVTPNSGTGVNGGNGRINSGSDGFQIPTLPAGAVVTAIYAVVQGTQSASSGGSDQGMALNWSGGSDIGMGLNGEVQTEYLGTDLSVIPSVSFTTEEWNTALYFETPANYWFNVANYGILIFYTAPSAPSSQQLQTLVATDFGFALPSGSVGGVEVNFNAGMTTGAPANLTVQLTLGGIPVGTPKFLSIGSWATSYALGSSSDLWGLASLTGAQINGPNGIGVNISGTLLDGSAINLNSLNITIESPGALFSDYLDAQEYAFDLTTPITGLAGSMTAYGSGTLTAQLLLAGIPTGILRTFTLPATATTIDFGGPLDSWGITGGFTDAELNNAQFGLRLQAFAPSGATSGSADVQNVALDAWVAPVAANFEWITTFVDQNGIVKNLLLDSSGNFYVENVTTDPSVLTLVMEGITPGSRVVDTQGPGVDYEAYTNGFSGSDMPLQYTANWIDRITQVGPGAAPAFTPVTAPTTEYPIVNITQYAASTGQFIEMLWSNGPGSTSTGNVITVYYSQTEDTTLTNAFTSGLYPVYVYMTNLLFAPANGVFQITSVGQGTPVNESGQTWYYFTYVISQVGFGFNRQGTPGNYQMTIATLTTGSASAIQTMTIDAAGTGWNTGDTFSISGVTGAIGQVTAETGGVPSAISIINGGTGASVGTGIATTAIAPSTGTGLTVNITAAGAAPIPVPGLQVGSQITVSGNSVSQWNSAWTVLGAPDTSVMAITGSQVSSGIATLNYAVVDDSAVPVAGQLVTITGTTNANGALNQANATIVSASGGNTGTFTINTSAANYAFEAEDGQASTAGDVFLIDPGPGLVGTDTDPIYGTGTGGDLTYGGPAGQFLATGTKQGTVFFITRNGYYTSPAPPVTFTVPENCTSLLISNIPVGPPNVVGRGIAITESGQNGTPGANFFTIPTPVQYIVNDQTFIANQLYVNDNTTTSVSVFFTDSVLLNALAIDVYGYNLFNQIEIGDPGWTMNYSGRNFYGLCRNKIQNFVNMSFDGGYIPASTLAPLGWSTPGPYAALVVSPKFGNAYYIQNTSDATVTTAGLISQSAYQDAYQTPILQPNTLYSVRVSASNPSGNTGGSLVISLTAGGITYGTYTLPFASMTTALQIFSGTLLTTKLTTVPSTLQISVQVTNVAAGADVLIDRVEVFPTAIPILTTTVYGSYAGLPEQVDGVTGQGQFTSENQQPVNGAIVMYDTFYGLKGWSGNAPGSSMYSWQASANLEPAQWSEPEVAQRLGGACGPLAFDLGEQWFVGATRAGLYLFTGGQPGKINHEIYQVWNSINWSAANSIWVLNDEVNRRLMVGVPMSTPNFWLPNAPVNENPTSPNVILMCNYQGLDSGEAIKTEPQMHTTMFGTLNAIDMRRKWSIWQIPSLFAAVVQDGETADQGIFICNGNQSSQVWRLDEALAGVDAFGNTDSLYTTAGLVELSKRSQMQGLGPFRLRWGYLVAALQSLGNIACRLLPNRLDYPEPAGYADWTVPGGFSPGDPAMNDAEAPLNFAATRTYVEFRENDGNGFELSNLVLHAKKDIWNALRGAK